MPTARQQAALGLLPAERLIWDGHAGGGGGLGVLGGAAGVEGAAMGMAEQTLMDAIEVRCMCLFVCVCVRGVIVQRVRLW